MASSPQLSHAVYVVDDDASVCRALGRLIRSDGWPVRTFESGAEVLEALRDGAPGCLVMDIRMPGMAGAGLLAELSVRFPGLPVIALSAQEDPAVTAGAMAFLRKPVTDGDLLGVIHAAIGRERPGTAQHPPVPMDEGAAT